MNRYTQSSFSCNVCVSITESKGEEKAQRKNQEELDPGKLIPDFLDYLHKYWLQIIELCTSEQIAEIFRLCDHEVRDLLINLVCVPEFKVSPESLDKVKKAAAVIERS